jgi:2-iminobutanoate/2-iminopropanoate deaminase
MKREAISVPGQAPSPILSPAVRAGELIWTAGHTGRDSQGKMADDIETQTRQTLENIKATLAAAGSSFDSVVKVNIYLTDINLRPKVNEIYLEYMPSDRPSRTCIGNAGFEGNTLIEIECVAVVA